MAVDRLVRLSITTMYYLQLGFVRDSWPTLVAPHKDHSIEWQHVIRPASMLSKLLMAYSTSEVWEPYAELVQKVLLNTGHLLREEFWSWPSYSNETPDDTAPLLSFSQVPKLGDKPFGFERQEFDLDSIQLESSIFERSCLKESSSFVSTDFGLRRNINPLL